MVFNTAIVYVIVGILVLVGVILFIVFLNEKKRKESLKEAALRIGFSFTDRPDKSKYDSHIQFNLFQKGHSRKLYNLMTGNKNGVSWEIFDYRYTIGGGKNSHTYNQTIALAKIGASLPKFYLGPEYFFHRIGNILGYNDIDFDNYPVFSKNYLLKGKNEAEIRKLFTPELISYLENQNKGIILEAEGTNLIYYRLSKRIKPEEIISFLEEAGKVISFFERKEF